MTVGIKGATYKHLVFIDADCYLSSNQWLKKIIANYTASKAIVIGYGPYENEPGFLNKMIRFDTTQIGVTYLSFARAGLPYMAVGRNMSYTKDRFFEVEGFKNTTISNQETMIYLCGMQPLLKMLPLKLNRTVLSFRFLKRHGEVGLDRSKDIFQLPPNTNLLTSYF